MMGMEGDKKKGKNNNKKLESNVKPVGSPGLYGSVVLGLFSFAAYLQFSAFRDKQR